MANLNKVVRPATYEEFVELLDTPEYLAGALLRLYSFQTIDEQAYHATVEDNGVGFNGIDARFLTSVAQQLSKKKWMTEKQVPLVRNKLMKYSRQMIGSKIYPFALRKPDEKEKQKNTVGIQSKTSMLEIRFPYDPDLLNKVKSLSGRRWNGEDKFWTAPLTFDNLKALVDWGFELLGDLEGVWKSMMTDTMKVINHIPGYPQFDKLRPYQWEALEWLEMKGGRGMLGDEMGLGKTPQTIAYWALHPELTRKLVICPASLKVNWQREIFNWKSEKAFIIEGKKGNIDPGYETYIINYDILEDRLEDLLTMGFQSICLDEAHFIKNDNTKVVKKGSKERVHTTARVRAALRLCKEVQSIIPLSGTLIVNRPREAFNILNLLDPIRWPNFFGFAKNYCNAMKTHFGWDFDGASKLPELYEKMKANVLRRKKDEVLKDLPLKIRSVIPMAVDEKAMKDYNLAKNDLFEWLLNNVSEEAAFNAETEAAALVEFNYLKQLSTKAKMASVISWIKDYLESGQKLVVFAVHHETIDALMAAFPKIAVKLDGRDSQNKRQSAVDRFQNSDECRLFIGNVKAAGVGLTLTAAPATATVELMWGPGDHDQAEDRVHRYGQKADSVNAYYLMGQDTVEEDIAKVIDWKRKVIEAAQDGREVKDENLLFKLINEFKKGAKNG